MGKKYLKVTLTLLNDPAVIEAYLGKEMADDIRLAMNSNSEQKV